MTTSLTDASNTTAGSPYHTRAYLFSARDGVMTDSYVAGAPLTAFTWVKDPAAGAVWAQTGLAGTIPAWQAPSSWYANITFRGAVRAYFVKEAELKTALLAIKRAPEGVTEPIDPATGVTAVRPLFTAQHADDIVRLVLDYTRLDGTQISGKVATFVTKVTELRTLLNGGFAQSNAATMAEFYAKSATVTRIDAVMTAAAKALHARAKEISGKYADLGTKREPPTSICLSNDVEATALSLLKAQFATYFVADAATGVKAVDRAALVNWLRADMGLISIPFSNDYVADSWGDVAVFSDALAPIPLGQTASTVNGTAVTAAQVNAKKAEVEALGQQIDEHYATLGTSSDTGALEAAVKQYMESTDLTGQFPEIVRRIVDARFYVQTWVTAWGEESAPSPPSAMVEPDQNDVCIVRPASATDSPDVTVAPAGLGIIGWRLYRSNSGNASSGFQLVPDLALIAEKKPMGTPDEVVRATYKEINRSGILGVTDVEVNFILDVSVDNGYVTKTLGSLNNTYTWSTLGATNQAGATWIRSRMLLAAQNDKPMTAAIARVLSGDYSLKLPDGTYNCFKLELGEYPDATKAAQLSEPLATTSWLPPPDDLRGLTGMANGIMAGFFGNAVCFSEAYTPYAWPVEYQITVDYPVVAVAAFGQTLFVGTQGSVYLISGSDPSSMSSQVMPGGQSCSSARSVVAVDNGVLFVSPEGICLADLSGVKVLTAGMFTRAGTGGWTEMNPSSMIAAMHDGVYYLLYERASGTLGTTAAQVIAQTYSDIGQVPTLGETNWWLSAYTARGYSLSQLRQIMLLAAQENGYLAFYSDNAAMASKLLAEESKMGCYGFDMASGKLTQVDMFGTAFYRDVASDRLFMANGTQIRSMFSSDNLRPSIYRTGVIQTPKQSPFAWLQVDGYFEGFDVPSVPITFAQSTTPTSTTAGDTWHNTATNAYFRSTATGTASWVPYAHSAIVKWYGDGQLRHTVEVKGLAPVRLPAGRYREHEIEIVANSGVTSVTLAGTTEELQNV